MLKFSQSLQKIYFEIDLSYVEHPLITELFEDEVEVEYEESDQ